MRSLVRPGLALALLVSPSCTDRAPAPEAAAPVEVDVPDQPRGELAPKLVSHVQQAVLPGLAEIPAERRATLDELAGFVTERRAAGRTADLVFICTHNSRRSQFGQVWAATAAAWLGVDGVRTFSGGTEVTAFNPRAIAALRRAGFGIEVGEGDNPKVGVVAGPKGPELSCHSKRYGDPPNPTEGFAAIMTCSAADASCPTVKGAALRLSLPYEDPKVADGTPQEAERYDERSRQIAAEMLYLMSRVES